VTRFFAYYELFESYRSSHNFWPLFPTVKVFSTYDKNGMCYTFLFTPFRTRLGLGTGSSEKVGDDDTVSEYWQRCELLAEKCGNGFTDLRKERERGGSHVT
jgi:hypothetical protein